MDKKSFYIVRWNSIVILSLTALLCVSVFLFYKVNYPAGDVIRGIFASLLAAILSLLLFYYVDPRIQRDDYVETMSKSGFRRVLRNSEFGPSYWVDLISEMATSESEVFLVGKRLSDWRHTPTYNSPLQISIKNREKRANECRNKDKYKTTIIVEDKKKL